MTTLPEPKLHWTDHYANYGFAVARGLVSHEYISAALDEVKRLVGNELPLEEWTIGNVAARLNNFDGGAHTPTLARIYDQPGIRSAIDSMFGSPSALNNDRSFKLFVKPFDPDAKRQLPLKGHIDFISSPVPTMGSGFLFQVSLVDKEPFGGNILVWPGTHQRIQKHLMDDPNWQFPENWDDIAPAEPFEFVPRAGDVLFFSHLIAHEGSACCTRTPRVSLHCQATRDQWLQEIDPAQPNLSPWERSLATNGRHRVRCDEKEMMKDFFATKKAREKKAKLAAR
jgi:hypothetical protein